ncbi:MAG: T9SS type A sorting domain-containing protein [Bacteroidetes bacterium]|nr:T9SS type A sorting domain-containing protein [Bacteroidota bacterium]
MAKDSMNFQVQFAPNKLGVYTANINIFNSDALFEQFNFRIRANSYVCATTNLVNTIVGNTTFCLGDSAVITAQTGTGYLWSNGMASKTISAKTSGKYFVNLFDALNCLRNSDTITITANPVPAKPIISQTGNELICSNPSESYYQWYYNGSYVDGGTAKVLKTTIAGSYYIVCKTPLNCSAKSDAFNFVPAVSSIYNQSTGVLNIYPNPVHDRVNILVEENYDYSIINLAGMEVQSGKIIKGNNSIELNKSIQKGIYMIRLNNDNGQLNQQIIKE